MTKPGPKPGNAVLNAQIVTRVPKTTKERVEEKAYQNREGRSELVRRYIEEGLTRDNA